ncbi:MAG: RnfABCDGE type electron transport complex subunit D [Candidatus Omnitrophota bacterium]
MQTTLVGKLPHIHARGTVAGIYWTFVLALAPLAAMALAAWGWNALFLLVVSCVGAVAAEVLAAAALGKPRRLSDGVSVLTAMTFACMCPPSLDLRLAFGGSFLAVFFGKEMFGGTGQYLFHPACLGQALMRACFPESFEALSGGGRNFDGLSLLLAPQADVLAGVSVVALAAGSALLLFKKTVEWAVPAIALLLCSFYNFLAPGAAFSWAESLFFAMFLITDFPPAPWSKRGRWFFAGMAAFLAVFLRGGTGGGFVFPFAVLGANALSPWIDRGLQPFRLQRT